MSLRQSLLAILVALLIAAGVYWFQTHFEKVKKEIEVGYQGEARNNHLLAAQRYFQALGVQASSHEGLGELPSAAATMILPGARYEMGKSEAQSLLRWVEAGGHLVVVPSNTFDEEYSRADPLLDPLGVRALEVEEPQSEGVIDVDWPGEQDFMSLRSAADTRLENVGTQKVELALADQDGLYLLRLRLGRGWITVLPDAYLMSNGSLALYDHAAYLWHVAQAAAPRPVWLVYQDSMPTLWVWLARHAWQVLFAAALCLTLILWEASRRFGPIVAPAPLMRRRLLDHLDASGRFLWRHGQAERLMKGVRQALYRALELRHPAWASLPSQVLYVRLSELTHLPQAQIQTALLYTHLGSEHEFTQVIQTLERIRKAL